MIKPPSLIKGDAIGLVAPARQVSEAEMQAAINIFKQRGYRPVVGQHLYDAEHQFAGSDDVRTADMQQMIENPEIKAIVAARGGYGCVRLVDKLNFDPLLACPKWLVGYSDLTVFHSHFSRIGLQSLHASMPINFAENSPESLQSLFDAMEGQTIHYQWPTASLNRSGKAVGPLVGGNLSVLYSLLGSRSFPDTRNCILFLEDLDEYLYHIDRMMMALKRAGALQNLSGLIVGGLHKMHDNNIPFGKSAEEIIHQAVDEYGFPVAFGFPAGHQTDNRALVLGAEVKMSVGGDVICQFL